MQGFRLSALPLHQPRVEVVERKGRGHPDSICDALAEQLSRDLCAAYRAEFGEILHHNVDKALLSAGAASPRFGGGTVERPLDIYLGGRATREAGGRAVALEEIAVEGARTWLRSHLRGLDVDAHVRIHPLMHPGSQELRGLFGAAGSGMPRANDTSIGVGFAPLSRLEQLVLALDRQMAASFAEPACAWGEDTKIMAVLVGEDLQLTISCAFLAKLTPDLAGYLAGKEALARLARDTAGTHGFPACEVHVNAADRPHDGQVYLTVTGTSAEAGDDGQVGRGNRINGLITPGRPMSLEAAAGKNPVSHVGKIYNVAAREIAESVVAQWPEIGRAECLLVSQIGAPIDQPSVAEVRIEVPGTVSIGPLVGQIQDLVSEHLTALPQHIEHYLTGAISIF